MGVSALHLMQQGPVVGALASLAAEMRRVRDARRVDAPPDRLSTDRAAALMDVHPSTIRTWVREGRLTRYGTDRLLRVSRAELLALQPGEAAAEVVDLDARAREIASRHRRR